MAEIIERRVVNVDMRHVANFLKAAINMNCEEGFAWYEDVGDMPSVFEVNEAIRRLDEIGDLGPLTVIVEE